jgi:hypothetical protein
MRRQEEDDLKCGFRQRRISDDQRPGKITGGIRERRDPARKICRRGAGSSNPAGTTSKFSNLPKEFFCPIQIYRPHKPITLLGRLVTHIQTIHGATKEEKMDIVHYFITKLLPNPIQAIITTTGGHRVKGRKCPSQCHSPGCSHVSGKEYQLNGHVNGAHKSMAKDIKKLG